MAPNDCPFRKSMFGLKTPMSKCRRRNYLDDFDGIRSILSYSNVKDNWTPYVQPQGDLFYVKESDHPGRSDRQYYYSDSVDHKEEKDETTFFADRLRESPYGDKHESRYKEKNKNSGYDNVSPDLNSYYEKLGHNKYSHNLYRKEDQNSSRSSGYSDSSPPHQELHNGDINHNSISRNVHTTHANNHGYDSDFYDKHSDVSVDRSSVDSTPTKPAKIKHVYITPNPYSCRNGESFSGIALCEKLFGITLYHYNHRQSKSSLEMTYKDRKLLVQHVLLSSPAGRSQQIHRGDMMVAVNDVGVTWENLETICNKLSSKVVKLSFQMPNVVGPKPSPPPPVNPQFAMTSPRPVTTPSPRPPRHRQPGENLSQLVFGDSRQHHLEYLQDTSCCVMYLTLEGDGSSDTESVREDIVYQYPPGDSKLLEVRGLFLTLCGVLPEVASTSARSSTLVHQRQKINIAYQRDGKDVLVIGLPADKVPKSCVEEILKQLHHLILVLYGPLHSAFRDMKHRSQIDQLFSLSLHNLHNISQSAMLSSQSSKIFTELIPAPKAINFTDDTKLLCDEILSEFEASDFDDFLDPISKDARREYSILGSCTFYKEYLLCNHLCQSDLQDVHLFLKHHCIIQMLARKPVEELVVWREMFPSQYCQKVQSCPQGYQDPHDARWFLLVIGMKQFLLCTLLEAGGCSRSQKGNPGPHPFIVSQAKATLLQFEADEVTMTQSIEHRLSKISKGPCLSCADSVITGHKQKKDENIIITPQKSRLSSKNSHDDYDIVGKGGGSEHSTPVMKRQGSKLSYGSNDSGESSGSVGISNKAKISKAGSVFDITSIPHVVLSQGDEISHIRLTRGVDNCLFHFISINEFEGTYISPTQQEMSVVNGALQEVILNHFYTACLHIRNLFQQSVKSKTKQVDQPKKYGEDMSFTNVKEQGVMFTCVIPQHLENSKKQPPPLSLTYWAVGRKFPDEKEMYVCFHESVPQTAIEMAFKLDSGLSLT
ncbi:protein inturned-like isoform X2 [Mytilus californianus]|uniref:protein inturned-like isoform X2 n=1 Tax=Mytilus californianus TaxID=6549 RepID=UPI00224662F2|nr:protein inturned-like isoform X2 [Mytilus californianus]